MIKELEKIKNTHPVCVVPDKEIDLNNLIVYFLTAALLSKLIVNNLSIDRLDRRTDEIGRRTDEIGVRLDKLGRRLDKSGRKIRKQDRKLDEIDRRIARLENR